MRVDSNTCCVSNTEKRMVCKCAHRPLVACMARVEPLKVCISLVVTFAEVLQGANSGQHLLEDYGNVSDRHWCNFDKLCKKR